MAECWAGTKIHLSLVTCDNTIKQMKKMSSTLIVMPPKSAVEWVAKMMVHQAQLDKELAQAKEEAAHKEREHMEQAMWEKQRQGGGGRKEESC